MGLFWLLGEHLGDENGLAWFQGLVAYLKHIVQTCCVHFKGEKGHSSSCGKKKYSTGCGIMYIFIVLFICVCRPTM